MVAEKHRHSVSINSMHGLDQSATEVAAAVADITLPLCS